MSSLPKGWSPRAPRTELYPIPAIVVCSFILASTIVGIIFFCAYMRKRRRQRIRDDDVEGEERMDIDPASHRSPLNNRRSRWRRIGKRNNNNNNNNGASTPPTRNGPRGTTVDNDDDDVDSLYLEKMATPPKNSGSKLRWRGRILASSFRSRHGSAASSRRQQRGGDASSISSTSRNPAPSVGNHRAQSEAPEEAVRDEDEEYTDNDDVVVEEAAGAGTGTGTLSSDVRAMGPELDAVDDRMATAAAVIPPGRLSPAPAPALAPSGHLHPPPAPLLHPRPRHTLQTPLPHSQHEP